jgi:hypothetical protein
VSRGRIGADLGDVDAFARERSRTKRPFCSSPTREIIATESPRRAAPTAVLAGDPPR